jgi:hypothetical protein
MDHTSEEPFSSVECQHSFILDGSLELKIYCEYFADKGEHCCYPEKENNYDRLCTTRAAWRSS